MDTEKPQDATSTKGPWGEPSTNRVPHLRIDTGSLSRPLGFENFTLPENWPKYGLAFFTVTSILFALILPNLLYKLGVFVLSMLFWVTFATCYFLYSTSPWTKISKFSLKLDKPLALSPTPFLEKRVERTGEQDELEEALNQIASWYSPILIALAILAFGWILGNFLVFFPGPGFETPFSATFFFAIQAWGPLAIIITRFRVFSKHPNGKLVLKQRYNFALGRIFALVSQFDESAPTPNRLHAVGTGVLFTRPFAKPGLGGRYRKFRFPWLTVTRLGLSIVLLLLAYPILLLISMVWIAWPEIQAGM